MSDFVNSCFYACVDFLHWLGHKTHTTYEEINIIIFIVIEPICFLLLLILYTRKRNQYKNRKK